jgi:hypothetical protein
MKFGTLATVAILCVLPIYAAPANPAAASLSAVERQQDVHNLIDRFIDLNNKYPLSGYKNETFSMNEFFTAGYRRSWDRAMTYNSQRPVWDGDRITGEQMVSRLILTSVTMRSQNERGIVAEATIVRVLNVSGELENQKITFDISSEGGRLKIDDIRGSDSPGGQSHREYFDSVK